MNSELIAGSALVSLVYSSRSSMMLLVSLTFMRIVYNASEV